MKTESEGEAGPDAECERCFVVVCDMFLCVACARLLPLFSLQKFHEVNSVYGELRCYCYEASSVYEKAGENADDDNQKDGSKR